MNERGFFTIIGLCLLLIVAISIKGVNEFETNYSRGVKNFQIEHKLQNVAESFLAEEFDNFQNLQLEESYSTAKNFGKYEGLENCAVQLQAKNTYLKNFIRKYSSGSNYTDIDAGENPQKATVILSVASCDSPFIGGKMYRRALAYVLDDDPATENINESETVHFMNDL